MKFTKSERVASADVVKFEADVPDSVAIGDDIVVSFKVSHRFRDSEQGLFVVSPIVT